VRLGLVGRGPQAQRYLMPKNGGQHIVSQVPGRIGPAEYQDWLQGVDGVIIATHPAGHRHLALDAIGEGKHVLIEKPLALNLEGCQEMIEAAERANVQLDVAHTHIWSRDWHPQRYAGMKAEASATYVTHSRDYSPWLDWAPHLFALMQEAVDHGAIRGECTVSQWDRKCLQFVSGTRGYQGDSAEEPSPMRRQLEHFISGTWKTYDFNRRVYRALFARENHGTT